MLFDSHAHLVSDDFVRYPPTPLSGTLDRKLDDPVTAERLLRWMDEQGVESAAAVQRAHVYGYQNDYVVDSAARYRDRLRAVCVIDADAADAPAVIRRWADGGAVGMRLSERTRGGGIGWLASDFAQAAWAEAERLGLSMCVHMYRWNRDEALAVLLPLARRHSGMAIVVDHLSNMVEEDPSAAGGLDPALTALVPLANVSLKFTQINLVRMKKNAVDARAVIARVVAAFGADRVMWGSDVAQSPGGYDEMVADARAAVAGLSTEDQCLLLDRNARRVYASSSHLLG